MAITHPIVARDVPARNGRTGPSLMENASGLPAKPERPASAYGLRLVYIIGTYPSLTTTFIDREVRLLEALDARPDIISIRRSEQAPPEEQKHGNERIAYLLPCAPPRLLASHLRFAILRPLRYFGTLAYLLTRPHPDWKARAMTLLHFGVGVLAAGMIEELGANHVHAHFVDRAATLAMTASRLLAIPYSVTAHANDIYVRPVMLKEKIGGAAFAVTCTRFNKDHLVRSLEGSASSRIHCIYHGLDMEKFKPRTGAPTKIPRLLAVGQLKEKKGLNYLLSACKLLKDRGYAFQCEIVGDGPLRAVLEDQIRQLSLEGTVTLCGALSHADVVKKYRRAAIFALPCVVAADGDRDGIPNVILEAMAMKLPVVATAHSGIPEVIDSRVNGILVPPGDEAALAGALAELLENPKQRREFGNAARRTVAEQFDVAVNVRKLLEHLAAPRPDSGFIQQPARAEHWRPVVTKR